METVEAEAEAAEAAEVEAAGAVAPDAHPAVPKPPGRHVTFSNRSARRVHY